MTRLTTRDGRPFDVDYEHDWSRGRTTYVTRWGTFVLSPPILGAEESDVDTGSVHVQYGAGPDRFGYTYEHRPDEPVFFGIPIHGGTVVRPDSMDAARGGLWVAAYRLTGRLTTEPVPDGTRRRVAQVVWALATHWLALPEHGRLCHAYAVHQAPAQLAGHRRVIENLTEQINELTARRAAEMRLADRQAELAAEMTTVEA
jgi:hypothetical protein